MGQRDEEEMIVVTHSAFLRHMLGEPSLPALCDAPHALAGEPQTKFKNCEMRSYDVYFD